MRTWGVVLVGLIALASQPAAARVYMTQEQALEAAFPSPHQVQRHTLYLDSEQARRAAETAGVPVETRVIPYYVGMRQERITGYAYFDTHLVRTLPETIMVRVSSEGRIEGIEILSFAEPEDYLPSDRWLKQFAGHPLDDELSLKGGIRTLTGATLSARAITQAARRILTLHTLFVVPATTPGRVGASVEAEGR